MKSALPIMLLLSWALCSAQMFPKSAATKASGVDRSENRGTGIEPPPKRDPPPAITVVAAPSPAPAVIPRSASSEQVCKAYFEKHKREHSACKQN
jgi:hypothetical protein